MLKIILVVIALLGLGGFLYTNSSKKEPVAIPQIVEQINYQAEFKIYTNGTLRDFSSSKYHNQSQDVYITSENPNIIYVKKNGITWDDFFKTLPSPMKLSNNCLITGTGQEFCTNENGLLKFFLNGQLDKNFLYKEIKSGDKALITYGNESEKEIQTQLKTLE